MSLDLRSEVKTGVYFTAAICPHSESKPMPDIDTENRRDKNDIAVLEGSLMPVFLFNSKLLNLLRFSSTVLVETDVCERQQYL